MPSTTCQVEAEAKYSDVLLLQYCCRSLWSNSKQNGKYISNGRTAANSECTHSTILEWIVLFARLAYKRSSGSKSPKERQKRQFIGEVLNRKAQKNDKNASFIRKTQYGALDYGFRWYRMTLWSHFFGGFFGFCRTLLQQLVVGRRLGERCTGNTIELIPALL